jgi:hypothetical protein
VFPRKSVTGFVDLSADDIELPVTALGASGNVGGRREELSAEQGFAVVPGPVGFISGVSRDGAGRVAFAAAPMWAYEAKPVARFSRCGVSKDYGSSR